MLPSHKNAGQNYIAVSECMGGKIYKRNMLIKLPLYQDTGGSILGGKAARALS
jgi:hypothetical protein